MPFDAVGGGAGEKLFAIQKWPSHCSSEANIDRPIRGESTSVYMIS